MEDPISKVFDESLFVLKPGEYHATVSDMILGTVTGSSVVVCLYDPDKKIGGMGHLIVPGTIGTEGIAADEIARVGVTHMEYLMGEIVKQGGDRKNLKAKVYGSGRIHKDDKRMNDMLEGNIKFIDQYFDLEKISIEDKDLGSTSQIKIMFQPSTGDVRKDEIHPEEAALFIRLEMEYIEHVFKNKDATGDVHVF